MSDHKGVRISSVIVAREAKTGHFTRVFKDLTLPNGSSAKVMNRNVFVTATGAANKKLSEVSKASGTDKRK